jgi:hypothetical protein
MIRQGQENITGIVKGYIEEGMGDGSLRGDIDPAEVAWFLIISIQSSINLTPAQEVAFAAEGISHEVFIRHVRELVLRSICSQDRERR